MTGYAWAIVSSIFFSLYIVPRKLVKTTPAIFSFQMSIAFFAVSAAVYIVRMFSGFEDNFHPILFLTPIAGVLWAFSFVAFIRSIDAIGLSRSNQWKNLQGPIGTILSLIILHEFENVHPVYAILSAVFIYFSALYFTKTSDGDKQVMKTGILWALVSGVGFGTVATIQKAVTSVTGVYLQQVIWSLSIALSLLYFIRRHSKIDELKSVNRKQLLYGLAAGVLYAGASYFQLLSFLLLQASIAFTIIQINALWTVLIGIYFFKEIDMNKYGRKVGMGFLFTVVGIVFLTLARK